MQIYVRWFRSRFHAPWARRDHDPALLAMPVDVGVARWFDCYIYREILVLSLKDVIPPCDCDIVVMFEETNLKFEKVQDNNKVQKSSKKFGSTYNHKCYWKTLRIFNIVTLLNCMQYNALQQGSWLLHIAVIKITFQFTKVCSL